ncbi:unnamed protein product, partial [Mesorhabditis belari]|uniref:Cystatin domain-containing protein n=1 Tax=Mesorhabditis belari TaxID=2138241 RepID=A0AAF3EM18_9BILA
MTIETKPPMPGAPIDIKDPNNDQEHMNRVWGAVNGELNNQASNNGPYHFVPIKILSAKSQVVAGMKHIYEVLVGESNCKKGEMQATELTQANCKLRDGANRAIYNLSVWERPWDNFTQYTAEKVRTVDAKETF